MLMTGFLSLNVHDSLTFDGTELCLHPDLFSTSSSSATGNANGGNHPGLAVGDMIEIRVWNPLPQSAIASSASSMASVTTAAATGGGTSAINTPATTPVSGMNRSPTEARRNSASTGSLTNPLTPGGNGSVTSSQNLRSASSLLKTPPPPSAASNPTSPPTSSGTTPTAGVSANASTVAGISAPAIPNESATSNVPTKIQTTNLRPRTLSMANSLAYSVDSE
eukprot:CAMPEP_0113659304 /NCGR_PEP_ID=MMETSP0017_2-20120614/32264_1 /TAXON_ID=2856 /ORGANISM="Cylindrotheca closterium" /LENGTH=221 /DNA_ID=CAMNT_0000573801 /DNA_START=27 /DNA_END=689 /DNA_ORIENTATION=- /assembly_acc=CAM_ASM_000147